MSHRGHSRRGGGATSTKPADETATTPPLQAHRRGLHEPVPSTHPQGSRQSQNTLCTRCRHRWHRLVRVPLGTSVDRAFALHVVRRRVCIRRSFREARCVIACVHGRVPQEGSFQIRRAWSASGHSFRKKKNMVQNFTHFQQYSHPGAGSCVFSGEPPVPRAEAACAICARLDWKEHRVKLNLFAAPPDVSDAKKKRRSQ